MFLRFDAAHSSGMYILLSESFQGLTGLGFLLRGRSLRNNSR